MREALVGFQSPVLHQLGAQRTRVRVRHDLVIIAVHHQCGNRNLLQIFREIGLGEGDDAIVVRLGATSSE